MAESSLENLIDKKKEVKKVLSGMLAFDYRKPLLGILIDHELSSEEEAKIQKLLEGLRNLENLEVIILADTNMNFFEELGVKVLGYGRKNRMLLLEASDIALTFNFSDIGELLLNGVVPITNNRPGVADYNPNKETGNSFIYNGESPWSVFAAIVRALETYKFPYDWKHIVRQGIKSTED